MKNYDVTALGELLIDFTESGISSQGNPLLEANPGGAPCNVLAMLSKLGKRTAFIGKVGADMFGRQLAETINEVGICTDGLVTDASVPTTLAFVHTFADGEREFSFIRNPGADMMLSKQEVRTDLIRDSKIFHFGTLSFDPNLREPLWKNLEDAKTEIEYGFSKCNLLKISDNEVEFLFGHSDYDRAARELLEKYSQMQLICITLGGNGSCAYTRNAIAKAPVYDVKPVEKTGAGDTFFGCVLNYVLEHEADKLTKEQLLELLYFANAGASLITTRKGALKVMPNRQEIQDLMNAGIVSKA